MRKMQLVLASLAAFPLVANALGLGGIRVDSALNEPLDARIELHSATAAEVRDLAVRLATHEAFSRAGIERASILMQLEFEVQEQGKGRYVVHIRSQEPIREPYLNFLLDAEWGQGRMLREYTLLLDPPNFADEPQRAVVQAPAVEAPATITRSQPLAEAPSPVARTAPMAMAPQTQIRAEPAAPETSGAPQPPVAGDTRMAGASQRSFAPDELFPRIPIDSTPEAPNAVIAGKSDTAWRLASKMRPEGVSVQQVLMALVKNNPDAFEGGNVNRLKAGAVLRLEDPALLTAMSRADAVQAVAAQNSAWENIKQRMAAKPVKQTVVASTREPGAKPVRQGRSELTLVSADGERSSTGTLASLEEVSEIRDVESLREQLTLAVESAETERSRNSELNDRMRELEEQLDAMQRLISLQDNELATLQQQLSAQQAAAALAKAVESPAMPEVAEAPAAEAPNDLETGSTVTEAAAPAATEAAAPATPEAPPKAAAPATPEAPPNAVVDKAKPAPQAQAAPVPAAPMPWWQASLATVGGALGLITSSPLLMAAAITVIVLLILSLMLVVRRRRKLDSQFQESILAGGPEALQSESEESSFLSDFAVSGMGELHAQDSEVDPLTEADVYMAYGRYQQAEELLSQASKKEPGRVDLKMKMLELYHTSKNTAGFTQLAGALKPQLGDGDPEWGRVLSMGREIAPQDPLFATGGGAPAAAGGRGMSDDEVLDIGLDTGIFQVDDLNLSGDKDAQSSDTGLDLGMDEAAATGFDLGLDEPAPAAVKPEESSLDFDLSFGEDKPGGEAAEAPATHNAGDLSFDLDFESAEPAAAKQEAPIAESEGDFSLDFDLSEVVAPESGDTPEAVGLDSATPAQALSEDDHALDFDLGDLGDLGLGEDKFNDGGLSLDADADEGDAAPISEEMDEVSTKLDLARAYIDMGDPDGARSILDEVATEGDNHQQQEAQQLLQQIA